MPALQVVVNRLHLDPPSYFHQSEEGTMAQAETIRQHYTQAYPNAKILIRPWGTYSTAVPPKAKPEMAERRLVLRDHAGNVIASTTVKVKK